MKPVTKPTLMRINEEFPSVSWSEEELEELVNPRQGVITGYQQMLDEIQVLERIDLQDIGFAEKPRKPGHDG